MTIAMMRAVRQRGRLSMARYSIAMLWLVLGVVVWSLQPAPDLQFHHIHIKVADQAAAMNDAADRLEGQRTILQGHGPAVRAGDEYLVFDWAAALAASPPEGDAAGSTGYERAVRWAHSNGLTVRPLDAEALRLTRETSHGRIAIVAFSSAAPEAAVERLRAKGIDPVEKTSDTARYRISPE